MLDSLFALPLPNSRLEGRYINLLEGARNLPTQNPEDQAMKIVEVMAWSWCCESPYDWKRGNYQITSETEKQSEQQGKIILENIVWIKPQGAKETSNTTERKSFQ